jgi:TonB family protein
LLASATFAQLKQLDNAAEKIANKIKNQTPDMIAVVDFTAPDGSLSEVGKYFAGLVTASIMHHAKKVRVANRESFLSAYGSKGPTSADLDSQEIRKKLVSLNVDFVITGTVEANPSTYSVYIFTRRSSDGSTVIEQDLTMKRSAFTDSLSEPFPPQTHRDAPRADYSDPKAAKNVTPPSCIHCPQPSYSNIARAEKIQATSMFDVLISADGKVVAAHPKKLAGYGLDEEAFNAIMGWHFNPATVDGKPTAVRVAIEVTFHLY